MAWDLRSLPQERTTRIGKILGACFGFAFAKALGVIPPFPGDGSVWGGIAALFLVWLLYIDEWTVARLRLADRRAVFIIAAFSIVCVGYDVFQRQQLPEIDYSRLQRYEDFELGSEAKRLALEIQQFFIRRDRLEPPYPGVVYLNESRPGGTQIDEKASHDQIVRHRQESTAFYQETDAIYRRDFAHKVNALLLALDDLHLVDHNAYRWLDPSDYHTNRLVQNQMLEELYSLGEVLSARAPNR